VRSYFFAGAYQRRGMCTNRSRCRSRRGAGDAAGIRKTIAENAGMIVEGTFSSQDRLGVSGGSDRRKERSDLAAGAVGAQRIDLFGHIEKEPALAAGEWRFVRSGSGLRRRWPGSSSRRRRADTGDAI